MDHTSREREVRRLVARVTRRAVDELGADADLAGELGIDSLTGLRVLAAVEKRWGVRFPEERLDEFRTIARIVDHIGREEAR